MEDKVVNHVYSSTDYKKFSFLETNRELRLPHVEELKVSIQEHPLNKPIDVNEKFQIIDGQHRYMAWWELGLPIIYIIHKGWGAKEVPILNTNQKNWNPSDFVKMYCDMGNDNYIKYREFTELYGFTHSANLLLLIGTRGTGNSKSANYNKAFGEGKFVIKKWTVANILAKNLVELRQYYAGYKRASFVSAYLKMAADPNFDHSILMEKIVYQSRKLVDCTSIEEYYELLREIYNFKNRNGKLIDKYPG